MQCNHHDYYYDNHHDHDHDDDHDHDYCDKKLWFHRQFWRIIYCTHEFDDNENNDDGEVKRLGVIFEIIMEPSRSKGFRSKQARKPQSYASSKLSPTDLLTGVRCRATSVAKKQAI